MLEIKDLTKKFNKIPVVKSISFNVEPGKILGYMGPNGAGKSTTIKMLACLLKPTSGRILWNGQDIWKDPVWYKSRIGLIPENSEVYSHLTGQEFLQLVGRLRQIPEKSLNWRIDSLMNDLELSVDMYLPIGNYSKGMKQKILISAALIHGPDILLLDEPLSGLDVSMTFIFKDILKKLARMGKTIIYSSHILEVVEKICDRVIIINGGKLVANGSFTEMRHLMKMGSFESIFKELVQQYDSPKVAKRIIKTAYSNQEN